MNPLMLGVCLITASQTLKTASPNVQIVKKRVAEVQTLLQTSNYPAFKLWMEANTTPDFTFRDAQGALVSRNTIVSQMKTSILETAKVLSWTDKISNVSDHTDHVSCTVKAHQDLLIKDHRRIVEDSLAVQTWKIVNGKPKLQSIVTTKFKAIQNGKTVLKFGISPGETFP
jgi:hypothetical protein